MQGEASPRVLRRGLLVALALGVGLLGVTPAQAAGALPPAPTDPLWSEQWSLAESEGMGINLLEAWRYGRGEGVVVAVIDSGIVPHPEFAGRVLPGYDFISSARTAGDGDGRDADPRDPGDWLSAEVIARDGFNEECEVSESSWHGTHVAGIIAAASGNKKGIVGIAPLARILPVRAIGKCGGTERDLIDALRWSAGLEVSGVPQNRNPAQIVNLSLGTEASCSAGLQGAVDELSALNVIVVASVGNKGAEARGYSPANCAGTVTVAATTQGGQRAAYSNYGYYVDLSAPGGDNSFGIVSTVDKGKRESVGAGYAQLAGTSMAAPHVTGALVIARGVDPEISREELLKLFFSNLAPFAADTTRFGCGIEGVCGAGFLDAGRFLAALEGRPTPAPEISAPEVLDVGQNAEVSATLDGSPLDLTISTFATCELQGATIVAIARGECLLQYDVASTAAHQAASGEVAVMVIGLDPDLSIVALESLKLNSSTRAEVITVSDGKMEWKSRTPTVCRVSKRGRIRGVSKGACKVLLRLAGTATYEPAKFIVLVAVRR